MALVPRALPGIPVARAERAIARDPSRHPRRSPGEDAPARGAVAARAVAARRRRGAAIAHGLALADELLAVNPALPPRARAPRRALPGAGPVGLRGDRALLVKARESLEQALEGNRFLEWEYGALLEQASQTRQAKTQGGR